MNPLLVELFSPEWARLVFGPYSDLVVTLLPDGCIEIEFMHDYTDLTHWWTVSPAHPQWAAWLALTR